MRLHRNEGLWDRIPGSSKRDWGNVTEHCLVETARVIVLADLLKLSDETKAELKLAAAMHDFFKKGEKQTVEAGGLNWASFEEASNRATAIMRENGISEGVVRLVNSVGHGSLLETEEILAKPELDENDLSYLVMHYVDDYTVQNTWVGEGDPLQDRMVANSSNARYAVLNEEGRAYFNGETSYEAQGRIGHAVEERPAQEIQRRAGIIILPRDTPHVVDNRISEAINGIAF